MGKSIRFSDLTKSAGRPHVAILWGKPESDPEFSRAIRENRVLTVRQRPVGTKADAGKIGFAREKNASYFIFPKALPPSNGDTVVGIKYELIEQAPVRDPISTRKKAKVGAKHRVAKPAQPVEKEFRVTIRKTAVWERRIQVSAATKASAGEKAREIALQQKARIQEAVWKTEIERISEVD
jgi:hypothetical protein